VSAKVARRTYVLAMSVALAAAIGLGLALVWLNIERVNRAYALKATEAELADKSDLVAKLEVERDNLLAPHRLREEAERLGLSPARPGQIRTLAARARGAKE
jgi:hypothetical protein